MPSKTRTKTYKSTTNKETKSIADNTCKSETNKTKCNTYTSELLLLRHMHTLHRWRHLQVVSVLFDWTNPLSKSAVAQQDLTKLSAGSQPVYYVYTTVDLIALVKRDGLSVHLYADETQYGSRPPSDISSFLPEVSECVRTVADWTQATSCNLTATRPTSCGLPLADVSTDFLRRVR